MTGLQLIAGNIAAACKDWPRREQIGRGDNLDIIRETMRTVPVETLKYWYVDGKLALQEFEQALDWALPLDRPTYRP